MPDDKLPTLRQLQYFEAVARQLNFRAAAAELEISQPALTAQVSALEQALTVILLERSRAGTRLTPEGRELLPHARAVINALQTLCEHATVLSAGHQTTYRLGVPPTLGPYLLPHVMPALHQSQAGLKLYVRELPYLALLQELRQGGLDLAILPLPLAAPDLLVQPLFTEPLRLVVPADHPLAGRAAVRPGQLRGEKVLTLEAQHHIHGLVRDLCERVGAVIQRDYEGTSLDTLRQMVVMGLGTAFLPALYIHSELHTPEALQVCTLRGMSLEREHGLAWRASAPSRHFYRELAAGFLEIISERLGTVVRVAQQQ
jgi:LysR family hydrogen peroxide-inducible transcriptional activator